MNYFLRESDKYCRYDLLVSEGEPVFVVPKESELRMEYLFELHEQQLIYTDMNCFERIKEIRSGLPLVVTLDKNLEQYGKLYAHLTGRSHLLVSKSKAVLNGLPDDTEIVVVNSSDWNMSLLSVLRDDSLKRPKGMLGVVVSDTHNMYSEIIYRAASICFPAVGFQKSITIDVSKYSGVEVVGSNVFIGNEVSTENLKEHLFSMADLLTIATHGDGYDASLSSAHLICPYKNTLYKSLNDSFSPNCIKNGRCHRVDDIDIEAAWNTGRLFSPEEIWARVLFIEGCITMPTQTGIYPSEDGFGFSMLRRSRSAVMLANSEVIHSDPMLRSRLVDLLLSESSVGKAVRAFNNTEEALITNRNIFCFGDSRYSL